MDGLKALSALFVWLREAGQIEPPGDFRRKALAELNRAAPFDRAIWAEAAITDRLSLRYAELYGIEPALRADYEAAAYADPRLSQVLGSPGTAHAYSVRADDPSIYRDLAAAIDAHHFISIAQFDPILGKASGMVLFGGRDRPPFGEADRAFVEAAFPHLMDGWTQCQVAEIGRAIRDRRVLPMFSAVCRGAVLSAAEPSFLTLFRREWPEWVGPGLPPPLVDPLSGLVRPAYLGRAIVVQVQIAVDTALVTARERSPVDDLTARERSVAELCAQGLTYKEISAALRVAPSTARNHIAAVHKRLGVTRNSEIARLLATVAAPDGG